MKNQGMKESEIIQKLKEQGATPVQINEGLEQAKIKAAVSEEPVAEIPPLPEQTTQPMTQEIPGGEMQPGIMQQTPPIQEQPQPPKQTQEIPGPGAGQQEAPAEEQYAQYASPAPQEYAEYPEYQPYSQSSPDTITEIAEQIVEEKLGKLRQEMGNLSLLKTQLKNKIENIDGRLKKIEDNIDKLQQSILGKIGSYGENIEDVKKEMSMMQDSFSKALNPLIDEARKKGGKSSQGKSRKTEKGRKRKSDGFEAYLR